MMKRRYWLLAIITVMMLLAGCRPRATVLAATPTALPTATPTVTPTATLSAANSEEYLAVFDTVWQTVNDTYFDPDFGSVDWLGERDRYEPLVAAAENDQEFYRLLNQMLWELNVSHIAARPGEVWKSVEPLIWLEGKTGLDVRLLEGQAVVTRVDSGSPAEEAGLRPGFVLESVDGMSVEQIIVDAKTQLAPPYNESGRIDTLTRALLSRIYGPTDTCVTIAWLDEGNEKHEACVLRLSRGRPSPLGGVPLPSSYLEFEARRLEEEIGYIRFNAFHPDLTPEMVAAVQSMQDAPGIIIDLRGNPGGSIPPGETLLGQFIEEQTRVATLKTRQGARDWIIQPADEPYEGAVFILIDPLSFSQSEWFASSMQAIGRAVIVGVRSPGGVTGANLARLPNGALLMYPVVQVITPAGVTLEGQGVIPDLEVGLDRDLLLQRIDSQLAAAIAYIEGQDTQ
jgi:carboxyl-terminal processing protease